MNKLQSVISFSIILGMAAITLAQQPENGTPNVRKLKPYLPQSMPTVAPLRHDRPKLYIPEPIPAPQLEGQVPTPNNLGVAEPAATGGQISPEPASKGTSLCPTATNCPRQSGLFKHRRISYCWGRTPRGYAGDAFRRQHECRNEDADLQRAGGRDGALSI